LGASREFSVSTGTGGWIYSRKRAFWYNRSMSGTLKRTVCVKLDVGEHGPALAATQATFSRASTWIARVLWADGIANPHTAHRRVYGETRSRFGLGAQLACCARAKALEAITAVQTQGGDTCPSFGPRGSVRYDARTYRLMSEDRVSLHVTYKAAASGVPVILVDPAYTSQTCSARGHCERANRQSQSSFRCRRRGFALGADHNAARNIAYRAAANRPMVSDASTGSPVASLSGCSARDKPKRFSFG
jgi:hypothetical protein